jgi:hypothetical protein
MSTIIKPRSADFEESGTSQNSQNLKFESEDWTSFRTVEGLQQKAGVAKDKLRRLVLKELTGNGLDEGGSVKVHIGELSGGGYFVEDDGHGIDGTPEEIARLFSIARPMVSTKLLRLPTRGALGNGLRVVAGAVLASEGSLVVITRNRRIVLRPERDGTTSAVSAEPVDFSVGTRVEISFGPVLPGGLRVRAGQRAKRCLAAPGKRGHRPPPGPPAGPPGSRGRRGARRAGGDEAPTRWQPLSSVIMGATRLWILTRSSQ